MTDDIDAKTVYIGAELSDVVVISKMKYEKYFDSCEKQFDGRAEQFGDLAEQFDEKRNAECGKKMAVCVNGILLLQGRMAIRPYDCTS